MLNFWDMVLEVTLGDGIIREKLSLYMYAASPSSKFWLLSESWCYGPLCQKTQGISRSTSLGKAPQPYLSGSWQKAVIQVAETSFRKTSIQTSNAYGTCWNMLPFKICFWRGTRWSQNGLWKPWKGPWYIFHNQGTSFNFKGIDFMKQHLFSTKHLPLKGCLSESVVFLCGAVFIVKEIWFCYCNCIFFIDGIFLAKARLEGSSQLGCFLQVVWDWALKTPNTWRRYPLAILYILWNFWKDHVQYCSHTSQFPWTPLSCSNTLGIGRYRYWECWDTTIGIRSQNASSNIFHVVYGCFHVEVQPNLSFLCPACPQCIQCYPYAWLHELYLNNIPFAPVKVLAIRLRCEPGNPKHLTDHLTQNSIELYLNCIELCPSIPQLCCGVSGPGDAGLIL